jgi:hypothetical protein
MCQRISFGIVQGAQRRRHVRRALARSVAIADRLHWPADRVGWRDDQAGGDRRARGRGWLVVSRWERVGRFVIVYIDGAVQHPDV